MAKKRRTKGKDESTLPIEARKSIRKLSRFCRTMHKGLALAETNSHAWQDIVGAIKIIQRVALIKSQDTLHLVKDLEKQTTKGPDLDELSREAVTDKVKLANTLIAQGMHWDKIEGALVRVQCLCQNEDETLRGPWESFGPELAVPKAQEEEPDL